MPAPTKIVLDSSSLISLADTCNIDALAFLKQKAGLEFAISPAVRQEIIAIPSKVKSLEFSALRIRKLVEEGTVKVESAGGLDVKTREITDAANRLYFVGGKPLRLIHEGEAESLALAGAIGAKVLAIDEKTTRLIVEDPMKLKEMVASEYAEKLVFEMPAYQKFRSLIPPLVIMRSAELLALAAKRGFFKPFASHEEEAFHASINSLRAAGCSLAQEEIKQYAEIRI